MKETRLIIRDLRGKKFRIVAVMISVAVLVSLLFSTSVLEVGSRKASAVESEKFGADMMLLSPVVPSAFSYETATSPIFVVQKPEGYLDAGLVGQVARLPGVEAASPQLFVGKLNTTANGVVPSLRFKATRRLQGLMLVSLRVTG